MQTSETTAAIAKALAAFQAEVKDPAKTKVNPAFKSATNPATYAPLDEVVKAIRAAAPKHGLAFVQEVTTSGQDVSVATRILHESGEWIQFDPLTVHADKVTAQGAGAAVTYARRFSLSTVALIAADDDDDGNASEPKPGKASAPPAAAPKPPAAAPAPAPEPPPEPGPSVPVAEWTEHDVLAYQFTVQGGKHPSVREIIDRMATPEAAAEWFEKVGRSTTRGATEKAVAARAIAILTPLPFPETTPEVEG